MPNHIESLLQSIQQSTQDRFKQEKTILSFSEYLEVVYQQPKQQIRDTALYLKDVFDYFGTETISKPYGEFQRFKLFDMHFSPQLDPLIGQEAVQHQIYGLLNDFIQEGKINKLILLHGPNGSAKTTTIQCITHAMEHYSHLEEGALYRFNWVFPSKKALSSSIGFGSKLGDQQHLSYAHLSENEIDAVIKNELREHPLLLLPKAHRIQLIKALMGEDFHIPQLFAEGDLNPKFAQIFEGLLHGNQGDLNEVFKYVQVERFYISKQYRVASSIVDPQLRVDAGIRQITMDRSINALPAALQNINLYESVGNLVEGNRGLIEFNDLLKRPIEAYKYLLSLCETGTIRLEQMNLFIDSFLIASSNEEHIQAFKEIPDFASFKGRIELIEVPYLLDAQEESKIYQRQLAQLSKKTKIHRRVVEYLSKWAVLSRLERPQPNQYDDKDKLLIEKITPLDKLSLYESAKPFFEFSNEEQQRLKNLVPKLYKENRPNGMYEGVLGASARELKALLLSTVRSSQQACFHSLALFDALKTFCHQESLYPFLKRAPSGEFYQLRYAIQQLKDVELKRAEQEILEALELVTPEAAIALFKKYIEHIKAFFQKEKLLNPINHQYEEVSEDFLKEVEKMLLIKTDEVIEKRRSFLQRIGNWRLDHPQNSLDDGYPSLFQQELKAIQRAYFEGKKSEAYAYFKGLLIYIHRQDELKEDKEKYAKMIQNLEKIGYCHSCLTEILHILLKNAGQTID